MTDPTSSRASFASRRDFLKTSTAATIGLGALSNAHAAGSDSIKVGKHLFSEKPVAVDGTGIRKVLAAYDEANRKGLSVVTGTQRRHQQAYLESLNRIHDGAVGDLVGGRVYWNQGSIWAHKRKP